ncbi:hypothetical protein FSP39_024586 [Pinctada imbricata]|uniref:Sulfotransferase domain-containing protein n=1 Tax=Pinctada imbricata TaxID=66713 RepID=A0AA88YR91_PINIB|nr:hypothetical protein FSP39_024586 [Pinctada imbricata]
MFYVYEPLKKLLPNGYYLKTGQECYYLSYPEICRNSTQFDSMVDMMTSFYDCNFSPKFIPPEKHSDAQVKVQECLHEPHRNASFCNKSVRSLCDASSVRMIKTIRLSMDVIDILMRRIPTLKIVHLIRDPRGMHKSRKKGGFLKEFKLRSHDAINLCNRYFYDFNVSEKLNLTYPYRIKRVLFEDLASNTLKYAKDIYNFLNLNFPPMLFDWISNHTSSNQKDGYYGTIRANSSAVANEWRDKLTRKLIKEIDEACEAVYDVVGYTPFQQ